MNALTTVGIKHIKDILLESKKFDLSMENNEEIASRLKFLGYIQKDEKINVRHVNRQANNWQTSLSRSFLYTDNRGNTLKFVRDVVSRTFDIVEQYLRKNNEFAAKSLVIDLVKSQQGLINLKHTYGEDTKFCCDIDVMIERIRTWIAELSEHYPNLLVNPDIEEKSSFSRKPMSKPTSSPKPIPKGKNKPIKNKQNFTPESEEEILDMVTPSSSPHFPEFNNS